MFSYRSLLKQAWDISWKHKYLWFLGLFASLTVVGGSWEYQLMTQNINQGLIDGSYYRLNSIIALAELAKNFYLGIINLFQYDFWVILNALSLLLASTILLISFLWLALTCQAALVNDVKKIADTKKKPAKLSVRASLTFGHEYFWSLLALNLAAKILIGFVFFLISLPLLLMAISDTTALATIYIIFFIIFIPLAMSLSLLFKYAIAYRVLDNKSFIKSIEDGFKLFKKNWLVSVEVAVILFIINFLTSGVVLILLGLSLLPLLLISFLLGLNWLITIIVLLAIVVVVIFGSLLTTFQTASWTILFLRLKNNGILAKLERLFGR